MSQVWVVTYKADLDNPHGIFSPLCKVFARRSDAIAFVRSQVQQLNSMGTIIVEDETNKDETNKNEIENIRVLLGEEETRFSYHITAATISV